MPVALIAMLPVVAEERAASGVSAVIPEFEPADTVSREDDRRIEVDQMRVVQAAAAEHTHPVGVMADRTGCVVVDDMK